MQVMDQHLSQLIAQGTKEGYLSMRRSMLICQMKM